MADFNLNSEQQGQEALNPLQLRAIEVDAAIHEMNAAFGIKPEKIAVSSQVAAEL